MSQGVPESDPLRQFLSGKRRHERMNVEYPVCLTHGEVRIVGRTIDISCGGALIAVHPADMRVIGADPEEVLASLMGAFCGGFDLRFKGLRLKVPAEMVRLSLPTQDADGEFYLGCRFSRALSANQQRKLAIQDIEIRATGS